MSNQSQPIYLEKRVTILEKLVEAQTKQLEDQRGQITALGELVKQHIPKATTSDPVKTESFLSLFGPNRLSFPEPGIDLPHPVMGSSSLAVTPGASTNRWIEDVRTDRYREWVFGEEGHCSRLFEDLPFWRDRFLSDVDEFLFLAMVEIDRTENLGIWAETPKTEGSEDPIFNKFRLKKERVVAHRQAWLQDCDNRRLADTLECFFGRALSGRFSQPEIAILHAYLSVLEDIGEGNVFDLGIVLVASLGEFATVCNTSVWMLHIIPSIRRRPATRTVWIELNINDKGSENPELTWMWMSRDWDRAEAEE